MSDRFRLLFMAGPVPTSITREADGTILHANSACLQMLGYEENEYVGKTVHEIGLWSRPERRGIIFEQLDREGHVEDLEEELRTKSGETVSVLMSISLVELDGERCVQGVFYDVTERRRSEGRLRESEQHFRQVTETVQQGFMLRDIDPPATLYASPAVARIFGLERDQVDRNPLAIEDVIHPDDREVVRAKRDAMTGPDDFEFRIVRPGGEMRWVRTRAEPVHIEHGQVERVAAVIADVTEERALHDALRESEERFRLLVTSVTDHAIIMLDPEGRVTGWNPGAERIKGYAEAEIIGRHFSVFYPPDLARAGDPQRELAAALAAGRYEEQAERVRKDGSRFWADITLTPILDDGGELRGYVKVTRDISERKRAEQAIREREERFRLLAENSTDVISRVSTDGTLLYVSPASQEVYGYDPKELIGRTARTDVHPEDAAAIRELVDGHARGGDDVTLEYRLRRKDGSYVWVETKTRTLRDPATGAVLEYQTSTRDISSRKRAEASARHAQVLAERANNAKSEFLSRMSHELRTPLHVMLGFGELLGRDDLSPGQREKLRQLTRSAEHLLDLINEVLDISRIERGELRLSLEPVHLGEAVRETLDLVLPLASGRSLTITSPPGAELDVHVLADRQRLKQVLLNLLSNAVKYNREGGGISLVYTRAGGRARVEVADTGIGIAADALGRVFEPFDRLGAEATEVEGTGLGLALSKRLMEAMDGEIGIDSVLGVGTTSWFEVPVVAAPRALRERPETESPIAATAPPGIPVTVLYVEDNPSNIKLVETILGARPQVTLIVATQGGLAIELAREHRTALILLDLNLPDISGEEVLRRLRGDARTAETQVVITSADATPGQIERMRRVGADDYLTKPFGVERLLAVVDAAALASAPDPMSDAGSSAAPAILEPGAISALHELSRKPGVGATAIRELVGTYLVDAHDRCEGIGAAIQAGNLDEVRRQSHALGGASGWAGATEVLGRCRDLEALAKAGEAKRAASVASGLGRALAEARAALELEFGREETG
ncbi:MAG TPA: PAS domain S-box protein [Solirubrobacteraceae bacterium]|nr:PAS domain S-box protein [Solirubrobacteraceae bacterium]